jgi:hypothetical protein
VDRARSSGPRLTPRSAQTADDLDETIISLYADGMTGAGVSHKADPSAIAEPQPPDNRGGPEIGNRGGPEMSSVDPIARCGLLMGNKRCRLSLIGRAVRMRDAEYQGI